MKHYLYYVLGLCLMLGAASCKKDEPHQNPPKPTPVAPVEEKIPEGVTATYWQVEGKSTDGKESQRLSLDFRPDGTYSVTYRTGAGESEARGLQSARALEWEVYSFSGKYSYRDGKLTILTIEYDRADGVEAGSPKIEEMKGYAQSLVGRVFRVNESERTLTLTDEKPSPSAGDVTGPFRLFILTPATSTASLKGALESARRRVDSLSRLHDAAAQEVFKWDAEVNRLRYKYFIVSSDSSVAKDPEVQQQMGKELRELDKQYQRAVESREPLLDKLADLDGKFNRAEFEYADQQWESGLAASAEEFIGSWRFYDRYGRHTQAADVAAVIPNHAAWTPFLFERFMDRFQLVYPAKDRLWGYEEQALGVELKELRINADGTGYADYVNSNPSLTTNPGVEFRIPFRYQMLSDRALMITTANVFGDLLTMSSPSFLLTLMTDSRGDKHLRLALRFLKSTYVYNDRPDELKTSFSRNLGYFYDYGQPAGGRLTEGMLTGTVNHTIKSIEYEEGHDLFIYNTYPFRRVSR